MNMLSPSKATHKSVYLFICVFDKNDDKYEKDFKLYINLSFDEFCFTYLFVCIYIGICLCVYVHNLCLYKY